MGKGTTYRRRHFHRRRLPWTSTLAATQCFWHDLRGANRRRQKSAGKRKARTSREVESSTFGTNAGMVSTGLGALPTARRPKRVAGWQTAQASGSGIGDDPSVNDSWSHAEEITGDCKNVLDTIEAVYGISFHESIWVEMGAGNKLPSE